MQSIKTSLRRNRLTRPVVGYLLDFLDEYRLPEQIESVRFTQNADSWPREHICLVVVCRSLGSGTDWLGRLGNSLDKVKQILWMGSAFDLQDLTPALAGKISFQVSSGDLTGQHVNAAIQSAPGDLIVLIDTALQPDENWLEKMLSPFASSEHSCQFSIGQAQPRSDWRALSLYSQMWDYLPFAGLAFRKQAWARAGGLPESLPLHTAWVLAVKRLKTISGDFAIVEQASAQLELQAAPVVGFQQAIAQGRLGLFATNVHRQIPSFAIGLLGLGLAIPFFFVLPLAWLLPPGIILLTSTLMAAQTALKQADIESSRLGLVGLLLAGFLRQIHFLGYVCGVFGRRLTRSRLEKEHEGRLAAVLARNQSIKGVIVYLPTHDWGFMFQRPHQLARHLARAGYLYFYCTRNELSDAIVGFQEVEPSLFVCCAPPETFSIIHRPIFLVGSPWYATMLEWFDQPLVIYDHYDDLEVSAARLEDHHALLCEAAIVLTTSQALLEAILPHRPDALLCPNAVDYNLVQQMRPSATDIIPKDLQAIVRKNVPVIGYSGALAEWFDYELVRQSALMRPNWQFVLIGVDYDSSLGKSGLLDCPNVHYLGLKSYQELFSYVWRFSVAIIPFVLNEITRATSPVKLFEYFACQKPVVSTPLPECLRYPEVLVAANASEFVEKVEQSLEKINDPTFLNRLDSSARLNTWKARVEQIESRLKNLEGEK